MTPFRQQWKTRSNLRVSPPNKNSLAPGCAMSWRHLPLHAKTAKQHWPIWPSDFRILMLCVVNSVNSCFSQFCTACGGYNTNFRLGNCKATLSRQVPSSYSKNRFSMLCQMHSKAAKGHARHALWWKKTPDYICVGWRKISWEMMRTRVWWVGHHITRRFRKIRHSRIQQRATPNPMLRM